MTLAEWRKAVDRLDRQIVGLLNRRARHAMAIGREKRRQALPVTDPGREAQILARLRRMNRGPLPDADLQAVYRLIMAACRRVQRRR